MIGALFVGNAAIFLWADGAAGLDQRDAAVRLAFIVYDVLFAPAPWFSHLSDVKPEHQLSLWLYLGVLVVSFVGGVYALFINPKTRIMGEPHRHRRFVSKDAARRAEKGR